MARMKRTLAIVLTVLVVSAVALAGTLSGKVSGAAGVSVVYVDTIAGKTFPAPEKHVLVDQKGLLFQPHIVVVEVGTTVDFLNSDNVAHNVFWPAISGDKKAGHNLGTWPKGEKKSYKFDKAGAVPLLCNVHPEMSGYVIVSPTPYYAETDAQGNYKIANLPDGDYKVVAWHEGAKPASKPVAVKGDTKADFTVTK
jgi:plastocyanin